MIQFDKFFHPVSLYVNYLIYIFMNIYENQKFTGKSLESKKKAMTQVIVDLPFIPMTISNGYQIVHWDHRNAKTVILKNKPISVM